MTKPRVLIIDDDPAVARCAARVLHRAGCEVHHAPDAPTGIEEVRQALQVGEPYAAILCDHEMPGGDSETVWQALTLRERETYVLHTSKASVCERHLDRGGRALWPKLDYDALKALAAALCSSS
ncbi:MAG: response regulator [Myxococcales bacterium]|nr:response regulator [Myxococcales bacterium]